MHASRGSSLCSRHLPSCRPAQPHLPQCRALPQSQRCLQALRHGHGGPEPFGIGLGIAQVEHEALEPPLPPSPKEVARTQRRAQKTALFERARNFSAPLSDLDEQQQAAVLEQRTRLLLGKFWGLMHEADRPWQREVVLHLCCTLPPEARRRYRALRPSTMQQLLSRRAQAEKEIHEGAERTRWLLRRVRRWLRQAGGSRGARSGSRSRSSGGSSSPPDSSDLEGAREQVVTLRANLGRTRANLQALASQAQGPLKDSDYGAYCRNTLDPVLQQLLDAGRQVERGVRSLGRGWSEGYAQPPMARGSGFRGGGAGLMGSRSADGYRTQSRWQQQEYEEQGEQEGWYGDADSGPAEDWGEEDEEHLQWAPQRTRVSGRLQGLLGTWGFEDLGSYSGLGWRYPPWPHVVVRRMGAPRIFLSARPPDEPVQVAGSLQQQQEEDDQW